MPAAASCAGTSLECPNRRTDGTARNGAACAACDRDIHDLGWILSMRIQPPEHTCVRADILEDSLRRETGIPIPLGARWRLLSGLGGPESGA